MYYNRFCHKLVLDGLDYFLISSFITSHLARYLKDYLTEKASMARLKSSVIKKARLRDPEPLKLPQTLSSKELRIRKVYMVALDLRGGINYDYDNYEYQLASKVKDLIMRLAVFLKRTELRGKLLKFIFGHARLALQLILSVYKIDLQFIVLDATSLKVVVIACCTGGATGFVVSWFSAAAALVIPPMVVTLVLGRSLAQQIQSNRNYNKFLENIHICLKDKISQKDIQSIIISAQKEIDNSKSIKLSHLNWNKNRAIKEAAERLGIFESAPIFTGQFTSDTLDPGLNKILEEFGLSEKLSTKASIKGKLINFRDFVKKMVDDHDKSTLDLIDAEIIQEPIRIRIRD
jgi:hypothetical protein